MTVKVHWEISGQGTIEVDAIDVDGMSDEDIENYIRDGVDLEIHEQGNYHATIRHLEEAIKKIRKEMEEENDG